MATQKAATEGRGAGPASSQQANKSSPGRPVQPQVTQLRNVVVALPVSSQGSPIKLSATTCSPILPKPEGKVTAITTPFLVRGPIGGASPIQLITAAAAAAATTPPTPQTWARPNDRKRKSQTEDSGEGDSSKRQRRGSVEKGNKGLRHFSMKVCQKVQEKGVTTYNEVADELVKEFGDPNRSSGDQSFDQKNIRRRVYDALNVLMAMNIISKEKKEIHWIGLPTNSAQECLDLETRKKAIEERIQQKKVQLQELIQQQIAFLNLVKRNRERERSEGMPPRNTAIQLPFIVVNTSKKTVIDCRISNDKSEYLFDFNNTFEIHDDIEVLKRMGMAFGLEQGQCTQEQLEKAQSMVPKAMQSYVKEMIHPPEELLPLTQSPPHMTNATPPIPASPLAQPLNSPAIVRPTVVYSPCSSPVVVRQANTLTAIVMPTSIAYTKPSQHSTASPVARSPVKGGQMADNLTVKTESNGMMENGSS